ncbi:HD-GYP domain-containing protein [Pleionea sp. CnH1-48]|uniref:HD-GYP domain-containing protein n=1 Tax=Pleionea sp. CnH1-48 TaxID=2954494 RepID=UPI0020975422|nr:HD-GYP domain-containing protein [Pleionea sp. CnH1-48]MCO7226202.1 DUF3391 domain-containing protein [Pleionea sp. CnH1-48]
MAFFLETRKVDVNDLQKGMYVSRLDIPWVDTDYPVQGFFIKNNLDIQKLCSYCSHVFIDLKKTYEYSFSSYQTQLGSQSEIKVNPRWLKQYCNETYTESKSLKQEVQSASPLILRASALLQKMQPQLDQLGSATLQELHRLSDDIIASAIRNPDALLWLCKARNKKKSIFDHCVHSAIWAILLGRHLGVNKEMLVLLCEALLLTCVGKIALPKPVWTQLNPIKPSKEFQQYLPETLTKLFRSPNLNPRVSTIIRNMGERADGSGVPEQKTGDKIPFLAQIASIAETFELIINPIEQVGNYTTAEALAVLYGNKGNLFDQGLVESFIQAVGIYPTGTKVSLSDNSQGIIIEQTKDKRIRALIAKVRAADGSELKKPELVDLAKKKFKDLNIKQEIANIDLSLSMSEKVDELLTKKRLFLF